MRTTFLLVPVALLLCVPTAFAQEGASAKATFVNAEGTNIGDVTLTQGSGGVTVAGQLTGVPEGQHGLHFHSVGNCDAADKFEAAGGHFNPTEHQHGSENPQGPHAGDLPNVTAAADGAVAIELTSDMISLTEGDPAYVFDADGTALVLHADPDDLKTDPSGNSGDRIACAVIEAAAP